MVWIKVRKDNHYLDCEALNVAAAYQLQVQNLKPVSEKQDKTSAKKHELKDIGFGKEEWNL